MLIKINGIPKPDLTPKFSPLGDFIIDTVKERIREESASLVQEITLGVLDGLRIIVMDLSYSIALVGGGLLIISQVAGYKNGFRYAGLVVVAHVFIRYLLGGLQ